MPYFTASLLSFELEGNQHMHLLVKNDSRNYSVKTWTGL